MKAELSRMIPLLKPTENVEIFIDELL